MGVNVRNKCGPFFADSSYATSFEVDAFAEAVNESPGPHVRYVDAWHPLPVNQTGTLFRPYTSLQTAASKAPDGTMLFFREGTYATRPVLFDRAVMFEAPDGPALLGG